MDYTGESNEYVRASKEQLTLLHQIRTLNQQAKKNEKQLEKICQHRHMCTRYSQDDARAGECMACANHNHYMWCWANQVYNVKTQKRIEIDTL